MSEAIPLLKGDARFADCKPETGNDTIKRAAANGCHPIIANNVLNHVLKSIFSQEFFALFVVTIR